MSESISRTRNFHPLSRDARLAQGEDDRAPTLPVFRVPHLPRVDLYGGVHRGLRLAHSRLLVRLGTLSYGDRQSVERVLAELEGALALGELHLAAEERHYHPALEARHPHGSERLDEQHQGHELTFGELRALALKLRTAEPFAAPAIGRALYLRYASFVADDLAHMAEEELVTLPLLHALYSDAELTALQARLVAEIPPREKLEFMALIVPASNREQRAGLLGGLRASMPDAGFRALLEALRPTLPAAEFVALEQALAAA